MDWLEASANDNGAGERVCAHRAGVRSRERFADEFANAETVASGLRVPKAIGDFLILDAIRASKGAALAVTDEELIEATSRDWSSRRCVLRAGRSCLFAGAEKVAGVW